jgi:hypothetical protein
MSCHHYHVSGIIFLTVNYAHIVSTFKSADSGLLHGTQAGSNAAAATASSSAPSGAAGVSDGSATAAGIGRTGAVAIKDCEVSKLVMHVPSIQGAEGVLIHVTSNCLLQLWQLIWRLSVGL